MYQEIITHRREGAADSPDAILHPAILLPDEIEDKLYAGAHLAEIGCGEGESVIRLAQAYPKSFFTGVDPGYASIIAARRKAKEARVTARVSFLVGSLKSYFGEQYDIVTTRHGFFAPVTLAEAAAYVREKLREEGDWLISMPLNGNSEKHLGEIVRQGGFTRFRRAVETWPRAVYEARP